MQFAVVRWTLSKVDSGEVAVAVTGCPSGPVDVDETVSAEHCIISPVFTAEVR
jgi:hypothetical protein